MSGKIEISRELAERLLNFTCNEEYDELHALLAAQVVERQPVAWSYCPECGCEDLHHEQGEHKQCANCYQEWFSDIDYSEVVRGNLEKLKASPPAPVAVIDLDVDQLAQIIRTVDGNHSLGAGALAERIIDKVKELNQ